MAQLQCDLQAAKSEKDSKYEAQLQKLASELSFKSDEVSAAAGARMCICAHIPCAASCMCMCIWQAEHAPSLCKTPCMGMLVPAR